MCSEILPLEIWIENFMLLRMNHRQTVPVGHSLEADHNTPQSILRQFHKLQ
jgi:hypothetical protein